MCRSDAIVVLAEPACVEVDEARQPDPVAQPGSASLVSGTLGQQGRPPCATRSDLRRPPKPCRYARLEGLEAVEGAKVSEGSEVEVDSRKRLGGVVS